jgi:ribosomal protein S18 acetylase RimI-like enzyme
VVSVKVMSIDPLDRAPWSSLTVDHRHLAEFDPTGRAGRYRQDVGLFGALDVPDVGGWRAAEAITRPGGYFGVLQADVVPPPPGWEVVFQEPANQFVAGVLRPEEAEAEIVELGPEHAPAMVALTELTQPGPFKAGTIAMGRYFGIFHGDQLVAMAGQRFRPVGHVEVSAVCTHPDARCRGYGGALTSRVVAEIRAEGRQAILHTRHDNHGARRLYEAMGFEFRRQVDVVFARCRVERIEPPAPSRLVRVLGTARATSEQRFTAAVTSR